LMRIILLLLLLSACTHNNKATLNEPIDYKKTDLGLIQLLKSNGSNVNKEHWVSYFVDCTTEQEVNDIILKAKALGFDDDYVSYSENKKTWSGTLSKSIPLNTQQLSKNRALLIPLFKNKSCHPILWGASVSS